MFYQILILVVVLVGSYLIGSIPNGVWIGKLFFKKDIREFGSKNSGGTNAGRVLGKKVGLLVIILDILKTVVPFWVSYFVLTYTPLVDIAWMPVSYYIAIFGAAIGHCWPIYVGFKGGKAVSAFSACVLCVNWFAFVVGAAVFFTTLKIKKYVSLASLLSSLTGVILSWLTLIPQIGFWSYWPIFEPNIWFPIVVTATAILLWARHYTNIKRILSHTERKITWLK